jgi:hypothetical protein
MLGHKLPAPVEGAIEKLLLMDRFNRLYGDTPGPGVTPIAERTLDLLNIHPQVSERDLALIPKQGPVVVVANHPFGLIEGAILVSVLQAQRADVKIMANHLLAGMPEAAPLCIFVDPFGGADASRANRKGLKNAIAWLKGGGLLAVFPAGEVVAPAPEGARRHGPPMEPQRGSPDSHHWRHGGADVLHGR